jgi:hypothetical protein
MTPADLHQDIEAAEAKEHAPHLMRDPCARCDARIRLSQLGYTTAGFGVPAQVAAGLTAARAFLALWEMAVLARAKVIDWGSGDVYDKMQEAYTLVAKMMNGAEEAGNAE